MYPYTLTPEQKAEKEARAIGREQEEPTEGANKELMDDFFRQLFEGRKKWIVPEETYCEWDFLLRFCTFEPICICLHSLCSLAFCIKKKKKKERNV